MFAQCMLTSLLSCNGLSRTHLFIGAPRKSFDTITLFFLKLSEIFCNLIFLLFRAFSDSDRLFYRVTLVCDAVFVAIIVDTKITLIFGWHLMHV